MVNEIELNSNAYKPQDFLIEKDLIHLNCGSFGMIPKSVHEARVEWIEKIESHSDTYISDRRLHLLKEKVTPLAEYIRAPAEDTVFVSNTTQGFCHVLETMGLQPGDLIVYSTVTYGAIQLLLEQLKMNKGIELLQLDYNAESDDELISYYQSKFDELKQTGKTPRLAIIDGIISVPGIILPFEKLTSLIQSYGTLVFVDGAHIFGQIKVNVSQFNPDFFVTNAHKWGYACRGTAILYVAPEHQPKVRNVITTFGYGSKSFLEKFNWFGTIDFSNWFSAEAGLEYRRKIGDDLIYEYNHRLAALGGNQVAQILGTKILGTESQTPFMVNVEVPIDYPESAEFQYKFEQRVLEQFQMRIKLFYFKNQWFVRLSAQLHLNLDDFIKAGHAIKSVLENDMDDITQSLSKIEVA